MASQSRYESSTTAKFSGVLRDHNKTVLPLASIQTLTLRLTNAKTGSVVNSRSDTGTESGTEGQDVLNAGNVTVNSTTGAMIWNIQASDTVMGDALSSTETHVAEFVWTYTHSDFSAVQTGKHTHYLQCHNFLLLCTFEDVKAMLGNVSDAQKSLVEMLIEGFGERVERITDRKFRKATSVIEYFSPRFSKWQVRLKHFPVDSISSVIEDQLGQFTGAGSVTINPDEYSFDSDSGLLKMRFRQFYDGVVSLKVTYSGGLAYEAGGVPMDLRMAATRQVAYWFQRRNQIGVSQMSVSRQGSSRILEPREFLPDVERVIDDYMPKYQ